MHRSVLSGTNAAVVRGESGSAPVTQAGESRPRKGLSEDQSVDRAQSIKADSGAALARLTALLLATLLFYVGWPGLAAPPGAYRPPLATIGNPAPVFRAQFGYSLAGVGNDRILIGVPQDIFFEGAGGGLGGSAYLFNTNGALVTKFIFPPQERGGLFGYSVAALGAGRVLIGARLASVGATNAGAVYLFNTNGTLLTTLTNPPMTPNDQFGQAVAAVGTDRVLAGARYAGIDHSGAAYILTTNGALLTTFHNPDPIFLGEFGSAVAGVGNDMVIIGAFGNGESVRYVGSAYLFTVGGDLLTTFTNPSPVAGGAFGWSVAGIGSDRVLIGAEGNTVGGVNAGAAYLFDTGGKVLTTFTNPAPALNTRFGHALAVVGGDRVLIGNFLSDNGAGRAGAAYLFDTNGTLLATFANPTPEPSDRFGFAVAPLGRDLFLIGADSDNAGATGAGSVYLYAVPRQPPLSISANASSVSVAWAGPEPSFILQEAGLLGSPAAWNDVQEPVSSNGPTNLFQQPLGPTNRFYRLRWP